ncbi:MAG: GIY-YIG nuclease family protein [Elusimicrobia bacterium]|nr:GIY-YIG nuclease family protein [Elusimicrobiota bacterium]
MKREKIHLVCQHLEKIHRKVLEKQQEILRRLIRSRHGIYALYKGNRLQYVGLATNLRGRLKHHLKDRHRKTWDHFSIYLTIESSHLHELEALTIRIASPEGNRQKAKLKKSENLKKLLKMKLRFWYKGKQYRAYLKRNGTIKYHNKIFTSP